MNKETFLEIIKAGIQAPSGDNLQPWTVNPDKDFNSFKLYGIKDDGDFFDVNNSATYISCGTFLENIKLAAKDYGYDVKIKLNDDSNDLFVGEVWFVKNSKKNRINQMLFNQIYKRATNRNPYYSKDLPSSFYDEVNEINNFKSNVKIRFVKNNKKINDILQKVDIIRFETKEAHDTLYSNIKFTNKEINSKVGLDVRTLGIPILPKLTMKMLGIWKLEQFLSITKLNWITSYISTKKGLNKSAGVGIITIKNNSKISMIHSGHTLEKVWLLLTSYGGYLQPFASLPFFARYLKYSSKKPFTKGNGEKIAELEKQLYKEAGIKPNEELMMIFRYGISTPPKIYSLRQKVEKFLKYTKT